MRRMVYVGIYCRQAVKQLCSLLTLLAILQAGRTAIMLAAAAGHGDVVRELGGLGCACVDFQDKVRCCQCHHDSAMERFAN